jgi:NADPH:quinone reductase-like Zn-dependent oxidoreductase
MKEAQVAKDLSVTVKDIAIPEPQANQVIIKVVVSGSNPKDWYVIFHLVLSCEF